MAAPASYPFASLGIITVAAAGTPVQVSTTLLRTRRVFPYAMKAKGTPNSGNNIYIQDKSGNALFVIPKSTYIFPLEPRYQPDMPNLFDWWIDADTSGDGLLVTYEL